MRSARFLALAAVVAALILSSCKTAGESFEVKFGTKIPEHVQVEHFWWSGFGMDHSYVWILSPADTDLLGSLVQSNHLRPAREKDPAGGLNSDRWPSWWNPSQIEALGEVYFRNDPYEFWRIWVDRESDRLYLQWFDV